MSEEAFNSKLAELQEQVKNLTDETAQLRRERDWARAFVMTGLPVATEEEEQAFLRDMQTGERDGLAKLIDELKANCG